MRYPLLFALLLTSSSLFAGKRILMEVADPSAKQTTTREILIDADRLRFNDGTTSMMFLTKGGERIVALDKARNEYREIDQATIQQLAGSMSAMMAQMQAKMKSMTPEQRAAMEQIMGRGAAAPASTTFTAKGASTVNGFRCTNYDGMRAGQKTVELCAAQPADLKLTPGDFQVMQKLRDFVGDLVSSLDSSPLAAMVPVDQLIPKGVNGIPVQTIDFAAGKPGERRSIKSVADASFTDADFSTGAAKKVDLTLPGAAGRGAKGKAK